MPRQKCRNTQIVDAYLTYSYSEKTESEKLRIIARYYNTTVNNIKIILKERKLI